MRKALLIALMTVAAGFVTAPAQPADSASPGLVVEAASIAADVQDREPVGVDTVFGADVGQVYCWARIAGAVDTTAVTFVWLRDGNEMARVDLPVKSPMFRTWSSKQIRPDWTGTWEVRILDPAGEVLKSVPFKITPAAVPAPEPEPADTTEPDTTGTGQ